jgi:hypothetical protein
MINCVTKEMNLVLAIPRHNYKKNHVGMGQVMLVLTIQTLTNLGLPVEGEVDIFQQNEIGANLCLEG